MKNKIWLLFLILCFKGTAQNIVLPIQHDHINTYESELFRIDSDVHTAMKPYASKKIYDIIDSLSEELSFQSVENNKILNLFFNDNLFWPNECSG